MELFVFEFGQRKFAVDVDLDLQLERVLVNGSVMSVKPMTHIESTHKLDLPDLGEALLKFRVLPVEQQVAYELQNANGVVDAQTVSMSAEAKEAIVVVDQGSENLNEAIEEKKENHSVGIIGIVIKIAKSAKVIKAALIGLSVAAYSTIMTPEFAIALVSIVVFHELGHVQAMKKFGIPTKGFYLIPFMGGVAIGDKPKTRWEDVYIYMMGPVYGLFLTVIFFILYYFTGSHFCGLVASLGAFTNLINLIPVLPLDGGGVVRALVFSRKTYLSLFLFIVISACGAYFAWIHGFTLFLFLMFFGIFDLVASWRVKVHKDMVPLKTYGIWFCLLWYLGVIGCLLGMILFVANMGVPGSELAVKILQS